MSSELPTIVDLCLETPLYKSYSLTEMDAQYIKNLHGFKGPLKCYCIDCNDNSAFKKDTPTLMSVESYDNFIDKRSPDVTPEEIPNLLRNHAFSLFLPCIIDANHRGFHAYFEVYDNVLYKISQMPSLSDLATADLKRYRRVLSKQEHRELSMAIRLVANGIGIGAFVYLRRIFEHLVFEVKQQACSDGVSIDEGKFLQGRMDVKIKLLKDYLPPFLVKNQGIYGILSKGIHELHEELCLDAFPAVKAGIELILEEKIKQRELEKKQKDTAESIQKIIQHLKTES